MIRPLAFVGLVGCSRVVASSGGYRDSSVSDVGEERAPPDVDEVDEEAAVPGDVAAERFADARPPPLRIEHFAVLPSCDTPADIFYVAPSMYVLCTRIDDWIGSNRLFFFNPADFSRPVSLRERYHFPDPTNRRSLNVFSPITGDWGIITANDGFYLINVTSAQNVFVPFPPPYNTGGGAVYHGGMLYIATANLAGTSYQVGTVLEYELQTEESGTRVTGAEFRNSIPTTQVDPTGMTYVDTIHAVAVLNSGPRNLPGEPTLDLISPETGLRISTLFLDGHYTASLLGHLTVTSEGEIVTASDDGSRQVRIVNPSTGRVRPGTVGGLKISSINVGEDDALYFTASEEGGLTVVLNPHSPFFLGEDSLTRLGVQPAGPALYFGGILYQTCPRGVLRIFLE